MEGCVLYFFFGCYDSNQKNLGPVGEAQLSFANALSMMIFSWLESLMMNWKILISLISQKMMKMSLKLFFLLGLFLQLSIPMIIPMMLCLKIRILQPLLVPVQLKFIPIQMTLMIRMAFSPQPLASQATFFRNFSFLGSMIQMTKRKKKMMKTKKMILFSFIFAISFFFSNILILLCLAFFLTFIFLIFISIFLFFTSPFLFISPSTFIVIFPFIFIFIFISFLTFLSSQPPK